ncbi:MAG: 50S ribosomal protein L19 [Deltaproteobacteria bacterium]|nr:50S ribosomal protein L19 [Deltaproteobacteria bacterium]MBI2974330.1 50S ribosomal protein L19 [Deltaproteobacteria bacterium]
MNIMNEINRRQLKKSVPGFRAGDTVCVFSKVKEGEKERVQAFEGVVVARKGSSNTETFTVRKVSYGVGVERIFLLNSPMIEKIEVKQQGEVRRAKLYYLRGLSGRAARIEEKLAETEIETAAPEQSKEVH